MLKPATDHSEDQQTEPADRSPGREAAHGAAEAPGDGGHARVPGMNVARTARSTLFALALTGLGLGLNYLFSLVLARWYGAADFGLFATGLAVMNAFVVIVTMGFDSIVLREVPAERVRHGGGAGWPIVRSALALSGVAALAVALTVGLLAQPIAAHVFPDAMGIGRVLAWFAAAVPIATAGVILLAGLQAIHDVRLRLTLRYGIDPLFRFAIGAGAFLAGATILGGVFAVIAASALTALIGYIVLRRRMTAGASHPSSRADHGRALILRLLRASWPLTLSSIALVIAGRSDIVLLLGMTDASQAGLYGGALVTAAIISIILQVIETIVAPQLSDGIARSGTAGIVPLYRLALRWTTLLAVPAFLFFALAAEEIMALLGPEFRAAGICFLLLSTAHLVNALTGSASYILILSGRTKTVLANSAIYAAVIITGNVLAIPHWGIEGAAVVLLAATGVINLLRLIEVRVIFGIHPFSAASIGPVMIGGLIIGGYALLRAFGVEPNPWAVAAASVPIYLALVLLTCLHPEDRVVLLKARRLVWR